MFLTRSAFAVAGQGYRLLAASHRLLRSLAPKAPGTGLLVVGSLRAGGSGKTCVVRAVAEDHRDAAILVHPTPDEQVWLEERFPGRVFADPSLPRARRRAAVAGFTRFVTDGGFQDPRLGCATQLLLVDPDGPQGLRDLHPFGPFRETAQAMQRADLLLAPVGVQIPRFVRSPRLDLCWTWRIDPPIPPGTGVLIRCASARPERLREDARSLGLEVREVAWRGDHRAPGRGTESAMANRHPGLPWVQTPKERAHPGLPRDAVVHELLRELHPSTREALCAALLHTPFNTGTDLQPLRATRASPATNKNNDAP